MEDLTPADDLKALDETQIQTEKNKIGVLLLHGLTGTPSEMKPVKRHLKKLGFVVEVPLLAGHGFGHRELLATTWQDWLATAQKEYETLQERCDTVFVTGMSMGALLAVMLAANNSKIAGIVVLAVELGIPAKTITPWRHLLPLGFKFPLLRRYCYWVEDPPYGLKDKRMQRMITKSIEAAKAGESDQYGLFRTYVGSFYQAHLLIKELFKNSEQVQCAVLIVHSFEDTMMSIDNATQLYLHLKTSQKTLHLINGCDHVMTVDLQKQEIARLTGEFIQQTSDALCQTLITTTTNAAV